jgi:energy-coupling factor transport system ATP-binding protein
MKVIEVKNLSYSYDGVNPAVSGLSFSVEEGQYCALIGHNGSGKSTLAKLLTGLISGYQGSIGLFGTELTPKTLYSLRSRMGIVFQNPDNQFVGSTVRDDIAFGLENRCVRREEMDGIIRKCAQEAGMENFLDAAPENLSGGQKQRVAIAGVLAMRPDILIYDEATSMLDPKGKKEILELTRKMREGNPKLTIISITHDIEEAATADEVLVLNGGRLILSGTPKEVFSHREELGKIHLDAPFYVNLIAALKDKGVAVPDTIGSLMELEEFLCR